MNPPFTEYRKGYIAVCTSLAAIYAVLAGTSSAACCIVDTTLYAAMLYFTGIILWNIFRYAFPRNGLFSLLFLSTFAVLTGGLMVGIESIAVYLFFPTLFGDFAHTIPVRLFITLLFFVIARLYYHSYGTETLPPALPDDTPDRTKEYVKRITVRSGQKIRIIPVEDILCLQAEGDYVSICTDEGHWLKEQTMKYSEEQLPPDLFLRVHRSCIVNISRISRIERYGDKQQIILRNGVKIKISAAGYRALRQRLEL
ncbi:MAG: LytTR family transcriptional regulator DNA-binding domain-containing protein [Tannerella sp.]|jgi:hypothetical protein|nr:LytTR family transcriptional regulator DNA-binding domain-containing protein [Tannerella sp.]